MNTTTKIVGGIGAAVVAGGLAFFGSRAAPPPAAPTVAGTPAPADICTGNYFYMRSCDTFWGAAWPGGGFPVASGPGHESQGCSAHTKIIVGSDWKSYAIIDQGPGAKGYKKPSDNGVAAAKWVECFQGPGLPGYDCATVQPPPGTQVYPMRPLSFVQPAGQRAAYSTMFGCSGPTPTHTAVPSPGPVPTPSGSHQFDDAVYAVTAKGWMAGCGSGRFCPDDFMTRAQVAAVLHKALLGTPPTCTPPGSYSDVKCGAP